MSDKVLLSLFSLLVCVSCQYYSQQYPYYGNSWYSSSRSSPYYTYPYYNSGVRNTYQSPCSSSCGNYQPVNYCHNFPCYQQQSYNYNSWPYPYYYNNNNNNRKVNTPSTSNLYPVDPYRKIYVNLNNNYQLPGQDQYANVPTEIIDDDQFVKFMKSLPKLPKAKTSSHSNYTVSQGTATSNSVVETKPIRAVVTRTFEPMQQNKPIMLNFLNGESLSTNQNTDQAAVTIQETETTQVQEITTTVAPTTTEEDEEVPSVNSWFSS